MSEWIPVTERLPQIGRNVLMFSTKGRCAEGEFDGSGWWQYRWSAWINSQEVTHWMPLPEPPEENRDENYKSRYEEEVE